MHDKNDIPNFLTFHKNYSMFGLWERQREYLIWTFPASVDSRLLINFLVILQVLNLTM